MTTANATMEKFGFPGTLIRDLAHWCILLRPAQVTLGSLVLVCKNPAKAFAEISPEAFSELAVASKEIETNLKSFCQFEKINYMMLMMVDPDVHFHVLPRYEGSRRFAGEDFEDTGWPGLPDLASGQMLDDKIRANMTHALKDSWLA